MGLTRFKVFSDYVICLILAGAAGLLLINSRSFDPKALRIIVSSIILSIATGLTFTLYTDPFGVTNMVGHLFQIGSFYLIYLAIIEALSALRTDPYAYDLLITDQTMPEMTGVELAREVLELRPDMPVILCTGFSHLVDADRAKAVGIQGFVTKPLTKKELAKTVRQALDRHV